jgi:hypothetical protein
LASSFIDAHLPGHHGRADPLAEKTGEIAIEFSGLRPGEKLIEDLLADADSTVPTGVARLSTREGSIDRLLREANGPDPWDDAVRRQLALAVPEYGPAQ